MLDQFLKEVSRRLSQFIRSKWTGQINIEINLSQGGLGSVYFNVRERMNSKSSGVVDGS